MLVVNDLGEPCAGEPHARFDGRGLETEHPGQGSEEEQPSRKLFGSHGFAAYRQDLRPRQSPTLRLPDVSAAGSRLSDVRDRDTIDAELRLLAAMRRDGEMDC